MNSDLFLELLNGVAIAPEVIWLAILGLYLYREQKRRRAAGEKVSWAGLPPSMNLILAIFIFDLAIASRTWIIWLWRRFGAGDFNGSETAGLIIFGSLVVIGTLCKIRALTYPDRGNGPWVKSAVATAIVGVAIMIF